MISLKVKVKDMEAKTALKGLSTRLKRPQKPLKECGLVLLRSIGKTFKAGGRPVRWKPSIRAQKRGGKTLIKTARLMRSISMQVIGKVLRVGTPVKYAAIHQLGGTIPARVILPRRAKALRWIDRSGNVRFAKKVSIGPTGIPARPFLVIQDADWRVFRRIFEKHLATDSRR